MASSAARPPAVLADPDLPPPAPVAISIAASAEASDQPKSANPSPDEGQDQGSAAAVAAEKKLAWRRPSPNGAVDMGAAVMGAASWPALSESAKASPKSSPADALKPPPLASDGSVSAPAGPANPAYSPKLNSNSSVPQPSSAANHAPPARQRSMKRGGGNGGGNSSGGGGNGGVLANGGVVPPSQVPAPSQVAPATPERHGAPQISPREHSARNAGGWDQRPRGGGSGSQPHGGGENHRGHGGNRRGNNGGGGDRHNNFGNRWDPERGGYDGYHHRGFSNRDAHMQQRGPRPFVRPHLHPVPPATYFSPYGNPPMVYSELASPMYYIATQPPSEAFRPMSFIPYPVSPPPVFISSIDPHRAAILKQIEYYFSPENLCKDTYLRDHMDEQGWVPVSVVAGFNKVKQLTDNVNYILETVRLSTTVEVQGENVRVRYDWMKWVLPSNGNQYTAGSVQQAPATPAFDGQADGF